MNFRMDYRMKPMSPEEMRALADDVERGGEHFFTTAKERAADLRRKADEAEAKDLEAKAFAEAGADAGASSQ